MFPWEPFPLEKKGLNSFKEKGMMIFPWGTSSQMSKSKLQRVKLYDTIQKLSKSKHLKLF
jgi:hypothetical protein